jgi:hypothetical protein
MNPKEVGLDLARQEAAGVVARPNDALMGLVFFFLILGTLFAPGVLALLYVVLFVWFAGKEVMRLVWQ